MPMFASNIQLVIDGLPENDAEKESTACVDAIQQHKEVSHNYDG